MDGVLSGSVKAGLVRMCVVLGIEARERRESKAVRLAFAEHKYVVEALLSPNVIQSS